MFDMQNQGLRPFDTEEALDLLRQVYSHPGPLGHATGFAKLDMLSGGLKKGELTVVAARPSMGKTAIALCIAMNMAREGKPVFIFSQEMSQRQLLWRMAGIESGISSTAITNGFFYRGQERVPLEAEAYRNFANAIKAVAALPLRVFDSLISTEKMFKEIEREIGDNNPPAMVIDDYLQLHLDTQGSNDTERLTLVTRNLKAMTLHFNIPLIAISQLSRAVEVRGGDFTPMLSDLRSSGSIEQDADVVWFLKRPEYYNAAERSNAGLAEVIIAKNRNGETGATRLHFDSRTTRFTDWQGRI